MTNNQGYGVWWDDIDSIGREIKCHRYFNTIQGANTFANFISLDPKYKPKVMKRELISDDQMDAAERSLVQKLNRDELTRLMLEFGFTIRAKDFANWRPTKRVKGTVPGVWETVELIATDGLLGMFLNKGNEPTVGHVHMFSEWPVETLFTAENKEKRTKVRKEKKKSKRQLLIESM